MIIFFRFLPLVYAVHLMTFLPYFIFLLIPLTFTLELSVYRINRRRRAYVLQGFDWELGRNKAE